MSNTSETYQQNEMHIKKTEKDLNKAYEELSELIRHIQNNKNPDSRSIPVMCAIICMNVNEAKSLQVTFDSKSSRNETTIASNKLLHSLKDTHDIQDISNFYREKREEWIPYHHAFHFESENLPFLYDEASVESSVETGKSIRDIITKLVKRFNNESKQCIELNFVTDKFFEPNGSSLWEEMRSQGGIIIIDAVSLLHEGIRKTFLNASVHGLESIAILAISPINPCLLQANQIIDRLLSEEYVGIHQLFQKPFDRRCEIARGDFRSINTWFYTILNNKTKLKATSVGISRMINEATSSKRGILPSKVWS